MSKRNVRVAAVSIALVIGGTRGDKDAFGNFVARLVFPNRARQAS